MTDWELLQQWRQTRSDRAFRELVNRHAGFVFSSALRQLGDYSLADEVTQAAFVLLSQKASTFREGIILPSWLFRTTRFLAARARRTEQRRKINESNAAMSIYSEAHPEADALWGRLGPHVDDALASLSEKDRQAVLLRFFQQKSLRDVAVEIGLSEDAAKKRVSRALGKLREWLQRRGIRTTAIALALAFRGRYAEAAPLGVISKLTATTTTTPLGSHLVAGALRDWLWTRLKIPAASIAALTLFLLVPIVRNPPSSQLLSSEPTSKSQPVVSSPSPPSTAPNFAEPSIKLIVRDELDSSLITSAEVTATAFASELITPLPVEMENGVASIFLSTESAKVVYVKVTAENRVPLTLHWNIHELKGHPVEQTCFLSKATQLTGIVVDETGRPIEGAQLRTIILNDSARRENFSGSETRTDFNGAFLLDRVPELSPALSSYPIFVSHPAFQGEEIEISTPADLHQNHRVVLKNGIIVRGIVTDQNHLPVAGAYISASSRREGLHGSVSVQSDSGGQFVLGAFPEGSIGISIHAEDYRYLATNQKISQEMEPLHLLLDELPEEERTQNKLKRFHFFGTVADANGQPVQNFRALFCNGENGIPSLLIGEGSKGHFDWTVSNTFHRPFCLMIQAPGFRPAISSLQQLDQGNYPFAFKLEPALFVSGSVVTPDGNFASGANVWIDHLNGPKLNAQSKPVSNWSRPSSFTNANATGQFTLELGFNSERLIAVHESGCIILPLSATTNAPIQLQPWSAIEGVLSINGKPAPSEKVSVEPAFSETIKSIPTESVEMLTDTQGRFHFRRLPPAEYRISGPGILINNTRLITLSPGRTNSIDFQTQSAPTANNHTPIP